MQDETGFPVGIYRRGAGCWLLFCHRSCAYCYLLPCQQLYLVVGWIRVDGQCGKWVWRSSRVRRGLTERSDLFTSRSAWQQHLILDK